LLLSLARTASISAVESAYRISYFNVLDLRAFNPNEESFSTFNTEILKMMGPGL
jgi:hypothetical protein